LKARQKRVKAVSTTIALIILLVLTVVLGAICYFYLSGTANTENVRCQLSVEFCALYADARGEHPFWAITLKNTGNKPVVFIRLTLHEDQPASYDLTSRPLPPGKSYAATPTLTKTYIVGRTYPYKVEAVASDGSSFSKILSVLCELYSHPGEGAGGGGGEGGGGGGEGEPFDFTVEVFPSSGAVAPGGETSVVVLAKRLSGQAETVTFSAENLPEGVSVSFDPPSGLLEGSLYSTATVSASISVAEGNYPLNFIGESEGGLRRSDDYTLQVSPSIADDFQLFASPDVVYTSPGGNVKADIIVALVSGDPYVELEVNWDYGYELNPVEGYAPFISMFETTAPYGEDGDSWIVEVTGHDYENGVARSCILTIILTSGSGYWFLGGGDGNAWCTDGKQLYPVDADMSLDIMASEQGSLILGESGEPPYYQEWREDLYPPQYVDVYLPPVTEGRLVKITGGTRTDLSALADNLGTVLWSYRRANVETIARGGPSGDTYLIGGHYVGVYGGTEYGFLLGYNGATMTDYTPETVGSIGADLNSKSVFVSDFHAADFSEWDDSGSYNPWSPYVSQVLPVESFEEGEYPFHWYRTVGDEPWLNAEDYPANYVTGFNHQFGMNVGDFYFSDTSQPQGTSGIHKVVLRVKCVVPGHYLNHKWIKVWIWDGSTWTQQPLHPQSDGHGSMFFDPSHPWGYWDVTQILDTLEKINAAKVRFSADDVYYDSIIDYADLTVTWVKSESPPPSSLAIAAYAAYPDGSDPYGVHANGTRGVSWLMKSLQLSAVHTFEIMGHYKILSSSFNNGRTPGKIGILCLNYPSIWFGPVKHDGVWYFDLQYADSPPVRNDVYKSAERLYPVPFNQWFEVRIRVIQHGAGRIIVWINGAKVFESDEVFLEPFTQRSSLSVGNGGWGGWDMYMDDFTVVDLGCDSENWGPPVRVVEWCGVGGCWLVGTDSGLYKFIPGQLFTKISDEVFRCAATDGNIVLIGGESGLFKYDGQQLQRLSSDKVYGIDFGDGEFQYAIGDSVKAYDGQRITGLGSLNAKLISYNPSSKKWLIVGGGNTPPLYIYNGTTFTHLFNVPFQVFTVSPVARIADVYTPPETTVAVTFDANLTSDASGSVLTVDGVKYRADDLPLTMSWKVGSSHSFSWVQIVPSTESGVRYKWAATDGPIRERSGNLLVSEDLEVTATYDVEYRVAASVSPEGAGSAALDPPKADGFYTSGSRVKAIATPNLGYAFSKWQADGQDLSTANPYEWTVQEPRSITAVFAPSLGVEVTFSAENIYGDSADYVLQVDGERYVYSDLPVTFNWQVGSTHDFNWTSIVRSSVSGKRYVWTSTSGLSTERSFTGFVVQQMGQITATYRTQYALSISIVGYGEVSCNGERIFGDAIRWFDASASVSLTATPEAPYVFDHWEVNGAPGGNTPSLSLSLTKAYNVKAVFVEHTFLSSFSTGYEEPPSGMKSLVPPWDGYDIGCTTGGKYVGSYSKYGLSPHSGNVFFIMDGQAYSCHAYKKIEVPELRQVPTGTTLRLECWFKYGYAGYYEKVNMLMGFSGPGAAKDQRVAAVAFKTIGSYPYGLVDRSGTFYQSNVYVSNSWVKLTLEVYVSPTEGTIKWYLNDVLQQTLTGKDTSGITRFFVGWASFDKTIFVGGWDDVAFTAVYPEVPEKWSYRKSHVINPAAGAGANYPVRITVHYGSGTDSGEHVYLNEHCKGSFNDVRFFDDDGVTPLDYWMESRVYGDRAVFWVKVNDDLSSNPQMIYVYYGNPSASRGDTPQNIDLWQLIEMNYDESEEGEVSFSKLDDTVLRITYPDPLSYYSEGEAFIVMPRDFLNGKKIQIHWRGYAPPDQEDWEAGEVAVGCPVLLRTHPSTWFPEFPEDYESLVLMAYEIEYTDEGGWFEWRTDTSDIIDASWCKEKYVMLEIISWGLDIDWVKILDGGDNVLLTYHFTGTVVMEQTGTYCDYGLLRKYVSPEPSHGAWGPEEVLP
jgi:hypothetical protein